MAQEAILYSRSPEGWVVCELCAHRCRVVRGRRGICQVRENREGTLYTLVYGRLVAENVDPIEKKPLYHFLPGSLSYSIATAGCNMSCHHCQNFQISLQAPRVTPIPGVTRTAEEVVRSAEEAGCLSISYTYTEPVVFLEFARDCGILASESRIANVFVTNGFMTPETVQTITPWLDAANIDLKGATEEHYRNICGGRLEPVLETIRALHEAGVWIEITTLLIPGLNDDDGSLAFYADFIASLDPLIPWHISRFHPTHRMTDRPPTPLKSLEKARHAGEQAGLKYVYLGNVPQSQDLTLCHACGHVLLERAGFSLVRNLVAAAGDGSASCPECGAGFHGVIK
ncbi:MAG: AmmeMemoRadiSam system radical SAM enzyme [bacterium]|nr:MAG: AmmeMemoRadiSam system radical SAM enzyme [bacterium]